MGISISTKFLLQSFIAISNEIDKGMPPRYEKSKIAKEMLFSDLFNEFMEKHSKLHKKSWKDDEYKYKLHLSFLEKKRISAIDKAEVIHLHSTIAKQRGIYSANRVLALLTTMFSKVISWGWDEVNPCIGIKKFREKNERDLFKETRYQDFLKV